MYKVNILILILLIKYTVQTYPIYWYRCSMPVYPSHNTLR